MLDQPGKRVLWIDIARAAGILVVLLVHTEADFGLITFFGGMFFIPVFFVISGYTFHYRPDEKFSVFAGRKAKRLLIPYFGYNLALFAFFFIKDSLAAGDVSISSFFPLVGILYSRNRLFRSGVSTNVYLMEILNSPTWFLTCLFLVFILFWLAVRLSKGDLKVAGLINCGYLAAAVLIHYLCPVLLPWSLDVALYAVSFMMLGYLLRERNLLETMYGRPLYVAAAAAVFVLGSYLNGTVNMSLGQYGRSMVLYLAVGSLGSILVMLFSMAVERVRGLKVLSRPLAFLGRHTVPVLCLHLFVYSCIGTAASLIGIV